MQITNVHLLNLGLKYGMLSCKHTRHCGLIANGPSQANQNVSALELSAGPFSAASWLIPGDSIELSEVLFKGSLSSRAYMRKIRKGHGTLSIMVLLGEIHSHVVESQTLEAGGLSLQAEYFQNIILDFSSSLTRKTKQKLHGRFGG